MQMGSWRCRHVYENNIGAELLIFWMLVLRGAAFAAWQVLVALSIDFGRPCTAITHLLMLIEYSTVRWSMYILDFQFLCFIVKECLTCRFAPGFLPNYKILLNRELSIHEKAVEHFTA
jgi:hypothetical protein